MMQITHMFDSDSPQLTEFKEKYRAGNKIASPDGGTLWTVSKIEVDDKVPPNPMTGKLSTKVTLTIGT